MYKQYPYIIHGTDPIVFLLSQGGNDHEIFADSRTIGHTVNGPDDTMKLLKDLFFRN